jgi:hypothetical protein
MARTSIRPISAELRGKLLEEEYPKQILDDIPDRRTKQGRHESCIRIARYVVLSELAVDFTSDAMQKLISHKPDSGFIHAVHKKLDAGNGTRRYGIKPADLETIASYCGVLDIIRPPHVGQTRELPDYFDRHLQENNGQIAFSR